MARVSAQVVAGAYVTTHFTTPIHSCLRSLFLFYYLENLLLFVYSHLIDPKKGVFIYCYKVLIDSCFCMETQIIHFREHLSSTANQK